MGQLMLPWTFPVAVPAASQIITVAPTNKKGIRNCLLIAESVVEKGMARRAPYFMAFCLHNWQQHCLQAVY